MNRHRNHVALLGALLLTALAVSPALAGGDRPNVVLISIDTLRADHLSAYGHDRETSPFFDQLAAEGVRYSFARSASPWTLPAHTTMLTGQLPLTHKVVDDELRLPAEVPVLPELMQQQGYATGGFVGTLYVSRVFGFDRGFDRFEDFDIHTEKANLGGGTTATDVVVALGPGEGRRTMSTIEPDIVEKTEELGDIPPTRSPTVSDMPPTRSATSLSTESIFSARDVTTASRWSSIA